MKLFLAKVIMGLGLTVAGWLGYHQNEPAVQNLGAFNPTGGQTYRLQSSISSTASSITLSSFKEPVSNIPYTMSYLNSSIMYATIDPQSSNKEFISFTGITQNSDGTATLTGVTRGLGFSYPYTASSTLKQPHSGQSILILSNPPQFYVNQFILSNTVSTSSVSTIISSTTPWRYDLVPTNHANGTYVSTTSELASVAYVNAVSFAGGVNATESVNGISELATQIEMASSTATGSTGASLVLQALYATSSPSLRGLYIPITQNNGYLSPLFIATSSTDNYSFGGQMTFASTSMTATTSIAASSLTNGAFKLNGLPYAFPSTRGVSGTILTENGSGALSWSSVSVPRYTFSTTSAISGASGNAFATSTANLVIPSGVLNASSTIQFKGNFICDNSSNGDNNCQIMLKNSSGATLVDIQVGTDQAVSNNYAFDVIITSDGSSINNQVYIGSAVGYGNFKGVASTGGSGVTGTSNVTLSSGVTLVVVQKSYSVNTTVTIQNYSIIVNP